MSPLRRIHTYGLHVFAGIIWLVSRLMVFDSKNDSSFVVLKSRIEIPSSPIVHVRRSSWISPYDAPSQWIALGASPASSFAENPL